MQPLVSRRAEVTVASCSAPEIAYADLGGQLGVSAHRGAMRTLDDLPEIAVARAIVQLLAAAVAVADGAPAGRLGGGDHLDREIDFGRRRREGVDDHPHLVG